MKKLQIKSKWGRRDLILLLERLELYVSSGLPIDNALKISGQGIPARQQKSIEQVHNDVIAGSLVSKSLAAHIGLSKTLAGLIEHGESSGELVRALGMARKLLEREDELTKKCLSALAYPFIIGIFASLLTIGLVRGVMPQIIPMLKSLHVQLPLITRIVMSISENIISYGLYALIGGIVAIVLFLLLYRKVKLFKKVIHMLIIQMPIVGKLVHFYSLSLFLQSCGALIESGLAVDEAYTDTVNTISLVPLQQKLSEKISYIHKGIPIGSVFLNLSKKTPSYISPLLLAGESSGSLGSSLIRAASIIDRDMEHALKRLTSLIEPVMMAGMGIVVGGIAVSIMMPIYDISKVLQH